jgi:autophagy-related protein 2
MGTPTSKYANQPDNVAEGLQQGLETVTRQLREARDSIFVMPLAEFEKNGFQSAVKQVARAVPIAVLKPVIGTTAGLSKVLLGVRNQIDKTEKVISEDKYRGANTSPGTSPGN